MKEIDLTKGDREKTYNWFKTFSNSTYGVNAVVDVTKLVQYCKESNSSFFINMLYIVVNGLNSVEEMRYRILDDKAVVFDDINPAYTIMTKTGTFENVRHKNFKDYKTFYEVASKNIEEAKNQTKIKREDYNPKNCYDEYYITCLPWLNFTEMSHPIPDSLESQCIPRICWGKFVENNEKYELTLNITVSHIFVDGYPLSKTFIKIQELLDKVYDILK